LTIVFKIYKINLYYNLFTYDIIEIYNIVVLGV
jgi:hypothetical protein